MPIYYTLFINNLFFLSSLQVTINFFAFSDRDVGPMGNYDWVPPPIRVVDSYHLPALLDVSFLFSQCELHGYLKFILS